MADAPKTKEQLEREWWDAWWAEDYSWEGLAEKEWIGLVVDTANGSLHEVDSQHAEGVGKARLQPATLQDYWRDQEGDLIASPDGEHHFTRVHLPLHWRDRSPTGKGDWVDDALDAILAPKLRQGNETRVTFPFADAIGVDRRTQLRGAVLLSACRHPEGGSVQIHLHGGWTCFARYTDFGGQSFGPGVVLYQAIFSDVARFPDTSFSGYVFAASSTFASLAWFERATFSEEANFGSTNFVGGADFNTATFVGKAEFQHTIFADALFEGAVFSGIAQFDGAEFFSSASFKDAKFSGRTGFEGVAFIQAVDFSGATFSEEAKFRSTRFDGVSGFRRANFLGDVQFRNATFAGPAWFQSATFAGKAWFAFAIFDKDAWFTRSLGEDARPATFLAAAEFNNAVFRAPARFPKTVFKGRMNFDKAVFESVADFSKVTVPEKEADWRAGFDAALFQRVLDIRGVDPKAVSLVAGATFDRGVILDRTDEGVEADAHANALKLARGAEDREGALKALESGALKLKQAMNAENDGAREQRFYRLELRARRKQKGTKLSERLVSGVYALASGYGGSLGRPMIALASVVAAFAVWFWAWEGGVVSGGPAKWPGQAASLDSNFVDSMRYSLSRTFPFGPWAVNDDRLTSVEECGFASRLQALDVAPSAVTAVAGIQPEMFRCRPRGGLDEAQLANHRLFVGIAGTLESLLSLPLYFLFGLSVRRKFQIN